MRYNVLFGIYHVCTDLENFTQRRNKNIQQNSLKVVKECVIILHGFAMYSTRSVYPWTCLGQFSFFYYSWTPSGAVSFFFTIHGHLQVQFLFFYYSWTPSATVFFFLLFMGTFRASLLFLLFMRTFRGSIFFFFTIQGHLQGQFPFFYVRQCNI